MDGLEVMEGSLWFGIHQGMLPKSNLRLDFVLTGCKCRVSSCNGRRKQLKTGEAITSVQSTHLLGGSGGMPPPGIFLFFDVVSEPISAKCVDK